MNDRANARRSRAVVVGSAILFVAGILHGCTATTPDAALRTFADRGVDPVRRVRALEALGPVSTWPDPAGGATLLHRTAWDNGQPDAVRTAAIDALLADDPAALRGALANELSRIERYPVLTHALNIAAEQGWRDLAGPILRSYARRSDRPDDQRPELDALERLFAPRAVHEVLAEAFSGRNPDVDYRGQVAAWTVLMRLRDQESAAAALDAVPAETPLVIDLRAAASVVDVLPRDAEGVLWLASLRAKEDGAWWAAAASRVAALPAEARAGLELRHLPVIAATEAGRLEHGRPVLMARVAQRLRGVPAAGRTDFGGIPGAKSERFEDHADALCWGDLLTLDLLLDALADRSLATALFAQAEADRADASSEHGGALAFEDGRIVARPFPPLMRAHDRIFYSSPELIAALHSGAAHYHFHAQSHDNAPFAGPGGGDLQFVENLRCAAVVFTFLDANTLNADYYQPGGVAIDLGVVRR